MVAVIGRDFEATLIGVVAGLGGTVGSMPAYLAGVLNSSNIECLRCGTALQKLMARFGGLIIFLFALVPFLPGDVSSIVAGVTRYSFRKYVVFHGMVSIIQMIVLVHIGAELLDILESWFSEWVRSPGAT